MLYPRGENENVSEDISIFLRLRSSGIIKVQYTFAVRDYTKGPAVHKFDCSSPSYGFHSFLKRPLALNNYLTQGALVIEVQMKPVLHSPPFIPDSPLTSNTLRSLWFNKEEYADVVFEIVTTMASGDGSNKPSTEKFYAHRNVLREAAPQLADMSMSDEKPSHVEISNISPCTFLT